MTVRIGIDLGGTKIAGVVLDAAGNAACWHRLPTPKGDYEATLRAICEVVGHLVTGYEEWHVGVGTPGVERPRDGLMKNCNSTWLNGRPLRRDLEKALGQPVRLSNDANCFALAEARSGAAVGEDPVFGVILGTGVGGGVVVGGQVVEGANRLGGEWGHTPLPYLRSDELMKEVHPELVRLEAGLADRACYCGRRNCVETFLSGPGLQQTHFELFGDRVAPESIALQTDTQRKQSWQLYCMQLARSVAQVVNLLDPSVAVLGGGVSNAKALYKPLNEHLVRYVFGGECRTRVVPAGGEGGDAAGAVGAAWLWSVEPGPATGE